MQRSSKRYPALRCARAQRDDVLITHVERIWEANMQVYGADKVWKQMNREGIPVARCTVERLMRRLGLRGVIRGKVVRTTISDARAPCPLDRVNRQFKADRPNQLDQLAIAMVRLRLRRFARCSTCFRPRRQPWNRLCPAAGTEH
jgi:putative transposase